MVVYNYLCSELCTSIHRRDWCNICATSMFCQKHKRRRDDALALIFRTCSFIRQSIKLIVQLYAVLSANHLCNRMRNGTSIIIEGNILEILSARTYPNYVYVEACANSKCAVFALTCVFYSITFFRLFCLFPFSFSHANTLQVFFSNFKHLFSLRLEFH